MLLLLAAMRVKFVSQNSPMDDGPINPIRRSNTAQSLYTYCIVGVVSVSTCFAQLVGYQSRTSLEVFKNNCGENDIIFSLHQGCSSPFILACVQFPGCSQSNFS